MPSARKSLSQRAALDNVPTFSMARAMGQALILAFISVWQKRRSSARSKSTGPAVKKKKSACPKWIESSPLSRDEAPLKSKCRHRNVVVWTAALCALLCCGLAGGQSNLPRAKNSSEFRPRREMPGEKFVGSQACAGCHAEKTRSQTRTAMANALKTPTESAILRAHPRMVFEAAGFSYEIVSDGQQSVYRVSNGKDTL